MTHKNKQTGSAIIVALFVVALVAVSAVAMLTRLQGDTRRAELLLNSNQAYLYSHGSTAWAIDQLINDIKKRQPNQIIDKTPIKAPKKTMNNATIEATLYDAQGFFNINNLTDTAYRDNFARLINLAGPNLSAEVIQNIVLATIAWISPGGNANSFDDYYTKQTPAYRAPHHIMASASELRLVKGMTPELYANLMPYIIALPVPTSINVNNAAIPVLMSLSPSLTKEAAKTITTRQQQTPFATTSEFMGLDIVKNNLFPENKITVSSSYFLLKTQVIIGEQTTILYTLLQRDIKNSQPTVTVLWQSKGTL